MFSGVLRMSGVRAKLKLGPSKLGQQIILFLDSTPDCQEFFCEVPNPFWEDFFAKNPEINTNWQGQAPLQVRKPNQTLC